MRANSWLYQFYSLHSKMHYGLTYEAHTARLPTYYPTPGAVMGHAYAHPHHQHHTNVTAGGAEAASVPIPYQIHSAITPLNGTTGHRHPHHPHHPQALLQYSPQAGSLPYPSIVTSVNSGAQTINETEAHKQTGIKRSFSPQMMSQTEPSPEDSVSPEAPHKRSNSGHHNLSPPPTSTYHQLRASSFAYPTSMFGTGTFSASTMTSVTDFGSVVPGYYGGPQVLTTVPYHSQIGHHFRNQSKMSFMDESDVISEPTHPQINSEDFSNIMVRNSKAG